MIHRKEFYFLRHGQTDHKFGLYLDRPDIPLNDYGRSQAMEIQCVISALPIKTVCYSPLIRAKETKDIVLVNRTMQECEIADLSECTAEIWYEMIKLGPGAHQKAQGQVKTFMERVLRGINEAIMNPGPVLIVAHGGVHWAACCFMEVDHDWVIDNCIPVHFTVSQGGLWQATKLI